MTENPSYSLFDGGRILLGIDCIKPTEKVEKLFNAFQGNQSFVGASIPSLQFSFKDGQCSLDAVANSAQVPISEKLLLGYNEAASMLSMTEQALRELVHEGKGPIVVKRGERVCFTHEGLTDYVSNLPREYPFQGIIEAINSNGAKPRSVGEQRFFNA